MYVARVDEIGLPGLSFVQVGRFVAGLRLSWITAIALRCNTDATTTVPVVAVTDQVCGRAGCTCPSIRHVSLADAARLVLSLWHSLAVLMGLRDVHGLSSTW